jgi:hypothetical protein
MGPSSVLFHFHLYLLLPLFGLLALHVRRGDYVDHGSHLGNWTSHFMPIAITVNRCIILRFLNVLSLLRAFVWPRTVLAFVGYASLIARWSH